MSRHRDRGGIKSISMDQFMQDDQYLCVRHEYRRISSCPDPEEMSKITTDNNNNDNNHNDNNDNSNNKASTMPRLPRSARGTFLAYLEEHSYQLAGMFLSEAVVTKQPSPLPSPSPIRAHNYSQQQQQQQQQRQQSSVSSTASFACRRVNDIASFLCCYSCVSGVAYHCLHKDDVGYTTGLSALLSCRPSATCHDNMKKGVVVASFLPVLPCLGFYGLVRTVTSAVTSLLPNTKDWGWLCTVCVMWWWSGDVNCWDWIILKKYASIIFELGF